MRASTDTLRCSIMEQVLAYADAQAILAANEIGLLEELAREPATLPALARRLRCSRRGLRALLDALAGIGVLRQRAGCFRLAPGGQALFDRQDPLCLVPVLQHQQRLYLRWARLAESVRHGRPLAPRRRPPGERRQFLEAMVGAAQPSVEEFFGLIDLSGHRRFLDLGGGLGAYAAEAARRYPHLECTLFDLPEAVRPASDFLRAGGVAQRVALRAGDARRDPLGGPYDAILISNVLHMFSIADSIRILRRARRALGPRGKIYLKDFYLRPDRCGPRRSGLFALNMLIHTEQGGVFTDQDYRTMFARAGLQRARTYLIGTASWLQVLRAPGGSGRQRRDTL